MNGIEHFEQSYNPYSDRTPVADRALGSCSDPRLLTRRLLGCLSSNCVWEREPHPLSGFPTELYLIRAQKNVPQLFARVAPGTGTQLGRGRAGQGWGLPEASGIA